jgi:hypothetical protein
MNKALEDLQAGRDPFAPSPEKLKKEFYQNIGRWSKWLAIFAAAFVFAIIAWGPTKSAPGGTVTHYVRLGLAAACVLMLFTSLILGVIALCAMPRFGSDGILKPTVRGIILSILCLAFFANGYRKLEQNRQALSKLAGHTKQVQAEDNQAQAGEQGPSGSNEVKRLNTVQRVLDQTAQDSTGAQALAMRAMSAFFAKAKVPLANYAKAVEPMKDVMELDMSHINRREQLQTQVQTVKSFMAASEALSAFEKNSERVLNDELAGVHLSQVEIDATMRGYRSGSAGQNELSAKMHEQDKRQGTALLGALNLLDANWGKWKYSAEQKDLAFDDHTVWKKYIAYLNELAAVAIEQSKLHEQLGALAKQ